MKKPFFSSLYKLEYTALLKPNGYLLLSEGIEPNHRNSNAQTEESAHEKHISRQSPIKKIKKQGYGLVFFREEATPFYTALLKLAPKALLKVESFSRQ